MMQIQRDKLIPESNPHAHHYRIKKYQNYFPMTHTNKRHCHIRIIYKLAKIEWLKSNEKAGQMDKNLNGTSKPRLSETEIYNPQGNQILKKPYIAQY